MPRTTGMDGASTAADRWLSDRKAARWLIRRFGAGAFRLNPSRGGGTTQVLFSGLPLVKRLALGSSSDCSVADLHVALAAAMTPTKFTRAQAQAALGARLPRSPTQYRGRSARLKKRAQRGAFVGGAKRSAGRRPQGLKAMTMAERQRIARARKALCVAVRELRRL